MARRFDRTLVRRFFLGVMKWTPRTLMDEATLDDLVDAYDGFMDYHGLRPRMNTPDADFLKTMSQLFPDEAPTP